MVRKTWKEHYQFTSNFLVLGSNKLHYIDEGEGHPIIMLHGNPTWSFYYRNIVNDLKDNYRCIVPDHIGCGLSSKPQDYEYTLENHIENVLELIKKLNIDKFSLIVHDWGGAIGMGVATKLKDKVTSVTLLNTAAFRSIDIPFRIAICKIPFLGERFVRTFNAFAFPATFMAVKKKLPREIKEGYLYPYNNYQNRIATAKFVDDIPLKKEHRSYQTLKNIEENLPSVQCPKLFLWGEKDFCFNDKFLSKWKTFYPNSKYITYKNAGHYVLEDEKQNCITEIRDFLEGACHEYSL